MKFFISQGARLDNPPETVQKIYLDPSASESYRKSPFIIQAACAGDIEIFTTLLTHGCRVNETGYIGLSKKRKNQVISNVVGAAAYNG